MTADRDLPAGVAEDGIGEDGVHVLRVRVYFEDTDATGIVYNANYLRFAERARTEFMRVLGSSHPEMIRDEGRALAVRRCTVDFLKPAVLDDLLEIHSRVVEVRGASMDLAQDVRRDGTDLAKLCFKIACMSVSDGRVARIPKSLKARLEDLAHRHRRIAGWAAPTDRRRATRDGIG